MSENERWEDMVFKPVVFPLVDFEEIEESEE